MNLSNPFARIVVGYDESAPAEGALDQALLLAEESGGEVVIVNVSDLAAAAAIPLQTVAKPAEGAVAAVVGSVDPFRRRIFNRLSSRVAARSVPVTLEFSTNGPAAGIIAAALRWTATAIAIGTHARSGIARAALGSVADEVVRMARVPVIVTRAATAAKPLRRIVVGIDPAEPASDAALTAIAIAKERDVRLVYATIVDVQSILQPIAEVPFDPEPYVAQLKADARDALDAAVLDANAAGAYPDRELSDSPDPAGGLIDVARRRRADAIVVGTHHRGSVARLFLGSTAESVLRRSDVPVIVVPLAAASAATHDVHARAETPRW
jgi:nucleotide-binding universal stress UspA family protein